jgi:hypothetical protein
MYVGGGMALLGIAIDCGLDWVPLLLALSVPLLHYGIILREERYLESKFGEEIPALQDQGSTLLVAILRPAAMHIGKIGRGPNRRMRFQ